MLKTSFFSLYKHSKHHIYVKANRSYSMIENYKRNYLNKKIKELLDLQKLSLDKNIILPKKIENFYHLEQLFYYGKLGSNLYGLAIDYLNHDKINLEIKKVIDGITNKDWENLRSCMEPSNSDYELFLKLSLFERTFKALKERQKDYIEVDYEALKKDIINKYECSKNSGCSIQEEQDFFKIK